MDKKEKTAYLKALIYIATADNNVNEEERNQFTQVGKLYGLTDDEVDSIADSVIKKSESIEDILTSITERSTKLLLLYDLLAICYVDNNYSIAEKNTMRTIANMLNIEAEKLEAMERVMNESVALQKRINEVLEK